MPKVEVILPALGEGIIEATLTKILAPVGTRVEEEEAIVEIATDKVDTEISTLEAGIVEQILYNEGDVIAIGQTVVIIRTEGNEEKDTPGLTEAPLQYIAQIEEEIESKVQETQINKESLSGAFLSPLVRNIIKTEDLSEQEVKSIKGTGQDGRLTKRDLLSYLKNRSNGTKTAQLEMPNFAPETQPTIDTTLGTNSTVASPGTELIEMDRMRRLISDHMVKSKQVSPHVSSFVEVDMTKIVKWRNKVKAEFETKYGQKLTFTPLFIEAAVKALRDFPMINVSVDGYKIIKKNFINIGMATALPSGNLIVPVIKNADQLNLVGLASNVNDLANRARQQKLKPNEVQGSTFSITNVGSFGNITGTPIINQPEAAILAVGVIQKKPAVIETPDGDMIGIRHQMIMAMSYDHRVVDGALGGMFLKRVADYLEDFDQSRII